MEPKLSVSDFGFTAPCLGPAGSLRAPSWPRLSSGPVSPQLQRALTHSQTLAWHLAPAQLSHLPGSSRTSWHKGSQSHLPSSGSASFPAGSQAWSSSSELGPCSSSTEAERTDQFSAGPQPAPALPSGLAAGFGNHKKRGIFVAPLSVWSRGRGNWSRQKSLAGRKYSHPLVACDFWRCSCTNLEEFSVDIENSCPSN